MCIASFNTFANAAALHRVCRVFALHPASFSGQQWTAKRCQIPEGTSIRHPCPSFLNYCGRSGTFSIEGYDSQKDLFDAVTNVTGVRTGVATTARNSDMSGMDHTIVSFMMRTVMITCKDRDQVPTDKRTIHSTLAYLSLSLSLVSACSSAVLHAYMSQLYHSFRQIIVLEKTPVILACPAQPATILPVHTQARPTFAAPITLATLRISRCQQIQGETMIRTLQSYQATATMSSISQDLQVQVRRQRHVRARHQSRHHQRSEESG